MAAIPIPGVNTPTYQTWGAAVAGKLNAFGWYKYSVTTDAAAWWTIPAANFGLSVVLGGVASVYHTQAWSNTDTWLISEVQPQSAAPAGASLQGRISQIYIAGAPAGPASWGFGASRSVVINAFAWGTA